MSTSFSFEDEQPWTTARCNRILRPISSRLAILRKNLEVQRSQRLGSQNGPPKSPANIVANTAKERKPRGFEKAADPDWVPVPKGKGNKRTYRGRAVKQPTCSQKLYDGALTARPGEISVPTPFIARSLGRLQDSPLVNGSPVQIPGRKGRRQPHLKPTEYLQTLKKTMTPDLWKQVDGLYDGFANLLKATRTKGEKSRKGTRSLMATCLRNIPAYIALEEYWVDQDDKEDDDDREISTEIYRQLESLGTRDGQGWRPLRQVARNHAISLLCDAIEDRVLELSTVQGLYRLCMNASAWDEAEDLLRTYSLVHKPIPSPSSVRSSLFDGQTSPYFIMVNEFVERTWRHQFLYERLGYMISEHILPLEWLATQSMLPIWSRIIRTVSDSDHRTYANACTFLETAVCIGAGIPPETNEGPKAYKREIPPAKSELRDALSNTFSSLFTLFSSIALVSRTRAEATDEATVRSIAWIANSLAIRFVVSDKLREDIELFHPHRENLRAHSERALWCVAAPFLLLLGDCKLGDDFVSIHIHQYVSTFDRIVTSYLSAGGDTSSALDTLPNFIFSTARCSGKAWKDDGLDQLQRIVEALLSNSQAHSSQTSWPLKRLAVDACLNFAEETRDSDHLAFARQIERKLRSSGSRISARSPSKTSASPAKSSGFRWEEGIGEWVACTPFVRQQAKRLSPKPIRTLVLPPTPVGSECETEDAASVEIKEEAASPMLPDSPESGISQDSLTSLDSSPFKPTILGILTNRNRTSAFKRRSEEGLEPAPKRQHSSPKVVIYSNPVPSPTESPNAESELGNELQQGSGHTISQHQRPRRSLNQISNIVATLRSTRSSSSHHGQQSTRSAKQISQPVTSSFNHFKDSNNDNDAKADEFAEDPSTASLDDEFVERTVLQGTRHLVGLDYSIGQFTEADKSEDELSSTQSQKPGRRRATNEKRSELRKQVSSRSLRRRRVKLKASILDLSDDELSFG